MLNDMLIDIPEDVKQNMDKITALIEFKKDIAAKKQEIIDQYQSQIEAMAQTAEELEVDIQALRQSIEDVTEAYDRILTLADVQFSQRVAADRQIDGK